MDLSLTPEQRLLAETARAFAERELSKDGDVRAAWAAIGELGWTGLAVPEAHGGSGRGVEDVVVVAEALGRAPVPTPLVASTLAALAISWAGTEEQQARWLPAIASGSALATVGFAAPGARDEWEGPALTVGEGGVLRGTAALVPWGETADVVLVAARLDGAPVLVAVRAVGSARRRPMAVLGTEPLAELAVDGEAVAAGDVLPVSRALLDRLLDHAAVLALAGAVGAAERALELSVEHARTREQFGRPIGSFQAVAHRCVDMRTDVDACRWLAYQAACALDRGGDAGLEVGTAKAYANDALRRVARHAHQVHGAVGFSTEHDLHLFTRRLKAFELAWGSTARHRERVARAIGL